MLGQHALVEVTDLWFIFFILIGDDVRTPHNKMSSFVATRRLAIGADSVDEVSSCCDHLDRVTNTKWGELADAFTTHDSAAELCADVTALRIFATFATNLEVEGVDDIWLHSDTVVSNDDLVTGVSLRCGQIGTHGGLNRDLRRVGVVAVCYQFGHYGRDSVV